MAGCSSIPFDKKTFYSLFLKKNSLPMLKNKRKGEKKEAWWNESDLFTTHLLFSFLSQNKELNPCTTLDMSTDS